MPTEEIVKDAFADDWETESSGGELFKWTTPGQKVTGLLTNRRLINTKLGAMTVLDITTREGDLAVPTTKSLLEQVKKLPANGTLVVQIEYKEDKKGNFPNPFKVFVVRTAPATEARLKSFGIKTWDGETTNDDEDPNTPR
jgi:hypothetical protein